jgi:alginate O-acetyltransferase complex protein AlgI
MLFNSLPFLFVFLPVTLLVFRRLRTAQQRYLWLTMTGYVFYGFWNWKFCGLMAFSTAVAYTAGRGLERTPDHARTRRYALLVIPIVVDLSLLGFFKYANFGLQTARTMAHWMGVEWKVAVLQVVLPVGISFYTFHTITYVVDCYRRVITPTRNLLEFCTYVSLFAQLVAGPIVRFKQIEADLERIERPDPGWSDRGWSLFALGLAKKVLIADTIARFIDGPLVAPLDLSTPSAWLCALGYSYQLYFDFSGYSDMAVGLGMMFGLRLPRNFDSPYQATDPGDFWRRWHITLSRVLRDYLYIPLGGNRTSTFATYRNLMITMVLGGVWHGANWTFVIWGGYHGLLLCLHRVVAAPWARLPSLVRRVATFLAVVVGWVMFRSATLSVAVDFYKRLFIVRKTGALVGGWKLAAAVLVAAALAHIGPNTSALSHRWGPLGLAAVVLLFAVTLLVIIAGQNSPFLYFQF